jgi:hypothetical protein
MVNIFNIFALAVAVVPFGSAGPLPSSTAIARRGGQVVSDHYIVLLKDGLSSHEFEQHQHWATELHNNRRFRRDDNTLAGIQKKYRYGNITGYAGSFHQSTIEHVSRIIPN